MKKQVVSAALSLALCQTLVSSAALAQETSDTDTSSAPAVTAGGGFLGRALSKTFLL